MRQSEFADASPKYRAPLVDSSSESILHTVLQAALETTHIFNRNQTSGKHVEAMNQTQHRSSDHFWRCVVNRVVELSPMLGIWSAQVTRKWRRTCLVHHLAKLWWRAATCDQKQEA